MAEFSLWFALMLRNALQRARNARARARGGRRPGGGGDYNGGDRLLSLLQRGCVAVRLNYFVTDTLRDHGGLEVGDQFCLEWVRAVGGW